MYRQFGCHSYIIGKYYYYQKKIISSKKACIIDVHPVILEECNQTFSLIQFAHHSTTDL